MSRLWFNLRILFWHLQIGDPHWWSVHIGRNRSITMSNCKLKNVDGEIVPWIKLFRINTSGVTSGRMRSNKENKSNFPKENGYGN